MKKFILWLRRLMGYHDGFQGSVPKEASMSEQYNPQDILERVKSLLPEMDWRFAEDPAQPSLVMGSGGKNGGYLCVLQVHTEYPLIVFHSYVQCHVPEEKRAVMAEFLTRANSRLSLGNFELDFGDGVIRFKTSLHIADGLLTADMLSALLGANVGTIDHYLPGIMSVLWNDVSPEDAIGLCEAS
jgi:hypothetical protein